MHEALARARREATQTAAISSVPDTLVDRQRSPLPDPERQALTGELSALIEAAVDALPQGYRAVVILREIEGLTTAETAACLSVGTDVVKTRLSRARRLLRASLNAPIGASAAAAFHFHASRCDRVVVAVSAGDHGSRPHVERHILTIKMSGRYAATVLPKGACVDEPTTDVIQGTLDLLILKTLSLEPMHGFGIARRVEQIRAACSR